MLRRLYDWTMSLAKTKHAERALATISFSESSVFPIPPDVILIPMVLSDRAKWFRFAVVATMFSVLGGLAGYAIGALLFDSIGYPVLKFYGYVDKFSQFQSAFNKWGLLVVFIFGGLTPLPYKVITIASGISGLSLPIFIVSSLAARAMRFLLVSWLLNRFGQPIQIFIEKNLTLMFSSFLLVLFAGIACVKYLL